MTSERKIDKVILKVVGESSEPISIKNMMFKMDKGNLHGGRAMRTIADRVYELRRIGSLEQVGVGASARYTLPALAAPTTEAAHQIAEGQRREAATAVPQLGECDLIDVGLFYILEPRTAPPTVVQPEAEQKITAPPPASVIVLGEASPQATEEPFGPRVDAIAQHIGTTVTLTVRQLIAEALQEKEASLKMQRQEIEKLGQQNQALAEAQQEAADKIAQLRGDIAEQEQLYNELDTRYNTLKQQIVQLAA